LAKSGKIGKNTEGVTSGCFDVKYDDKKIKKAVFTTTKKNKKAKLKSQNKKKPAPNTAPLPTRRKSPRTKPKAAGMQGCNRSCQFKKRPVLRLNKRNKN
jgi:hypothetical protein